MSSNLKYNVKYISNSCTDKDDLLNKPHQSVAESLYDLLENHSEIAHPVIGLEGSWGSGKSQVISILQKMIADKGQSSKYAFHTYDIWSVQEDLTRRSFLDCILSQAKDDNEHFETKLLEEDYTKLNATTTKRSTKSFPLVRTFFACLLLIPIMLFLVNAIEAFFGYRDGAAWTYDKLRGFLSLVLSCISLVSFILAYIEEYKAVNSDDQTKEKSCWDKFQIIVGRLFYIFKAKDVEKTDYETIIKDEPSISRFQNFFDHIHESLKDNTTLVIVFDNMDRLSDAQKLMATWSLLHTFFAEKKYEGKVWAIVPYAKQQLNELMTDKDASGHSKTTEFINKTFFTSFRIPEPIMGSWKDFLEMKLDEAFSPQLDADEKNIVTLIFSRSRTGLTIRPRDIISYVNRLVAIYSQHHFEDIPMKYVALYAQFEECFTTKPVEAILSFKGFESIAALVGKDELSGWLSSIYYNLPSSIALEVVFDREIQTFLQCDYEVIEGKDETSEAYSALSNNQHFHHHIEEFFNKEVTLEDFKLENIFYLLNQKNISNATKQKLYNLVYEQCDKLKDQLSQYESWMEPVFMHYKLTTTNNIIKCLLSNSKANFDTHYMTVVPLLKLQTARDGIIVPVSPYKTETPKEMLEYYEFLKDENATAYFGKAKISVDTTKLLEYMKEGVSGSILFGSHVDSSMYELLQLMKKGKYDLSPILSAIKEANISLANQEHSQVEKIYRVFNIIAEKKTDVPLYTIYNTDARKFLDIPEFVACMMIQLKNRKYLANEINVCFAGNIEPDYAITSKILASYIFYNELLKAAVASNNTMLKRICVAIAENKYGSLNSVDDLFGQTKSIIDLIFADDAEVFLSYLDSRIDKIIELSEKSLDYLNINEYWRNSISKDAVAHHKVYELIKDKWLNVISDFVEGTWLDVFSGNDKTISEIILKLNECDELPKDFWSKIPVDQISEAYISYVANNKTFDSDLFFAWKQESKKAVLAKLANDAMDAIENPKHIEESRFVQFVSLLLSNSERVKDPSKANAIYDDYVADYLSKNSHEHITQHLCEYQKEILLFASALDDDRKELMVEKLNALLAHIDENTSAYEKILNLRNTITPIEQNKNK